LSEDERRRVAYHEMGHALVAAALPGVDPVQKVSIFRAASALSATRCSVRPRKGSCLRCRNLRAVSRYSWEVVPQSA
jgi:ATP-dependent Zn protease